MTRRLLSGFCAFALLLTLAAFPIRARAAAMAAFLPAIGGAVAITAVLGACGIHPFSDNSQAFAKWVQNNLGPLIKQYNDSGAEITLSQEAIKAYLVNNTICIAKESYEKIRSFVGWCVDKFKVQPAEESVSIGIESFDTVSYLPSMPWPNRTYLKEHGAVIGTATTGSNGQTVTWFAGKDYSTAKVLPIAVKEGDFYKVAFYSDVKNTRFYVMGWYPALANTYMANNAGDTYCFQVVTYGGHKVYYDTSSSTAATLALDRTLSVGILGSFTTVADWIPRAASFDDEAIIDAFYGFAASPMSGVGLVADTDEQVSIPSALPETADFAGFAVPAAGESPTVAQVEGVIKAGVEDRAKPVVRPVQVEVAEGTEVDTDTGEIAGEVTVIDSGAETIPATDTGTVTPVAPVVQSLTLEDYQVPSLSTVFPFSIPWDIVRVWQALDAEPRFPLQDFSMTIPPLFGLWSEAQTVSFSLDSFPAEVQRKMDDVAFVVRMFLLVVACVGFLVFIAGFLKF